MRPADDDLLPDLPPLLDDGESLDEAFELDVDETESGGLDDALAMLDDATLLAAELDDEPSWLDDGNAEVALEDDEAGFDGPEYGLLDDAPLADLDLGIDTGEEGVSEDDGGEEGTEDPLTPGFGDDDDAVDLPVIDESDDEELDEPLDEGLDIDADLDDEPAPRTHRSR